MHDPRSWRFLVLLAILCTRGPAQSIVDLEDSRLGPQRTLDDAVHPWSPPTTFEEWREESQALRERILVSVGLWPLPERTPLDAKVNGRVERDDYTVEKVVLASLPGHYVTGNLYRPRDRSGKLAGVLCPHGHWRNGRMYDAGPERAAQDLKSGAEGLECGARFPLQARMVELARMGCVVFHYDMVGFGSSRPIGHGEGFTEVDACLRLQSAMGLQTWNSIRALDFLCSLPDVDSSRIGVTGASGGGTQTFILCAIDPRPAAAFPAVMASTAMQGGCICENAAFLRIDCNNIAFSALCAPRPLGLTGANDWTLEIETKGLPELRSIYALFGRPDHVQAWCHPQFDHNYNQVSREHMYEWFNRHLGLEAIEPIREREFVPIDPKDLEVFDAEHPLPADAQTAEGVKRYWTTQDFEWMDSVTGTDPDVSEFDRVVGVAARVLLDRGSVAPADVDVTILHREEVGDTSRVEAVAQHQGRGTKVPVLGWIPKRFMGRSVLWLDERGRSALTGPDAFVSPEIQPLLDSGRAVFAADLFGTGEREGGATGKGLKVHEQFYGYTYAYNRPLLTEQVTDAAVAALAVRRISGAERLDVAGSGKAGVWALLLHASADAPPRRTLADIRGFGFSRITRLDDPMLLPGALKYGGLGGLTALARSGTRVIAGSGGSPAEEMEPLERIAAARGLEVELIQDEWTTPQMVSLLLED